jgi:hypothetical protein
LKNSLIEVNMKNARILWVKLAFEEFNVSIFSIYVLRGVVVLGCVG